MAQITLLTGPERRRRWSDADRERILKAAFAPGAIVADIARQFEVSTSLIYKWREQALAVRAGAAFVPAVLAAEAPPASAPLDATAIDYEGHISKQGDGTVRTALYEAASSMMTRSKTHSTLKAWGLRLAAKRGHKRALVAVARKLAVIMHRMWMDGSSFRFSAADRHGDDRPVRTAMVAAMLG